MLTGISALIGAKEARKQGELQARFIEEEGLSAAQIQKRKDIRTLSRARALTAASGVSSDIGSPLLREQIDMSIAEENLANIKRNMDVRTEIARRSGRQKATGTVLAAGGSILTGLSAAKDG